MIMPKPLQEILDHADGLAASVEAQFEEWRKTDEYAQVVELWEELVSAVKVRADAERNLTTVIAKGRAAGFSWGAIGTALGVSGEAARKRYRHVEAA